MAPLPLAALLLALAPASAGDRAPVVKPFQRTPTLEDRLVLAGLSGDKEAEWASGMLAAIDFARPDGPPNTADLPRLITALRRVNGAPLDPRYRKALSSKFPGGGVLEEAGIPSLWERGLLGRGIAIGVVDTGVPADVEYSVARRVNLLDPEKGQDYGGPHGAMVTRLIARGAPLARISSYRALADAGDADYTEAILSALDRAVADGNRVINLSFGGPAEVNSRISHKVKELAWRGVIFVAAAGNSGAKGPTGVDSPAAAPGAIAVGSLDVQGGQRRMSRFTNWGLNGEQAVPLLLTQGASVPVKIKSGAAGTFAAADGTSFAAPQVTVAAALLLELVDQKTPGLESLAASAHIQAALSGQAKALPKTGLPAAFPPEQRADRLDLPAAAAALEAVLAKIHHTGP